MKFFEIVIIVGFVGYQVLGTTAYHGQKWRYKRTIKEKLLDFLENDLRRIMRDGNNTLGIPKLDVFESSEQIFQIDTHQLLVDGTLFDFFVEGVSNYRVDDGDISLFPPKVTVSMSFPEILAKGFYAFNGEALGVIPLYGEGKFDVIIRDFSFDAAIGIGLKGDLVKSLKLNIDLKTLKLDATGLYHDNNISDILSVVISDMVPNFIRDFHNSITAYVEPIIIDIVNEQLNGMSWKDLIGIIG
ncbi:hypothetical protein PV328_005521 [Microctonus aethiopoides]|uniref:Uncharacterized protein n=1 Tax=Microctonus aethiopoides TaxID=144406 RepID=A0AA39FM68_9HYME|nr:hypothetical protein PV328_005521 [Microctonus aethiopoides]